MDELTAELDLREVTLDAAIFGIGDDSHGAEGAFAVYSIDRNTWREIGSPARIQITASFLRG